MNSIRLIRNLCTQCLFIIFRIYYYVGLVFLWNYQVRRWSRTSPCCNRLQHHHADACECLEWVGRFGIFSFTHCFTPFLLFHGVRFWWMVVILTITCKTGYREPVFIVGYVSAKTAISSYFMVARLKKYVTSAMMPTRMSIWQRSLR